MRRRIVLSIAATLGLVGLVGIAPAEALPACGYTKKCVTTYYTHAYFPPSGVVGQRGVDCGNRQISWGVITPHGQYTTTTCLN